MVSRLALTESMFVREPVPHPNHVRVRQARDPPDADSLESPSHVNDYKVSDLPRHENIQVRVDCRSTRDTVQPADE